MVFVSAALFFIRSRRLAVLAALASGIGLLLMAFVSPSFYIFMAWIFLFSMGQHMLLPLNSSIAIELAHKGKDGKRLGQMNSVRNMATVLGSFLVYLGFTFLHIGFAHAFMSAALVYIVVAVIYASMEPGKTHSAKLRLKLHKEYTLFYWLSVLFGTRKQLFLTFDHIFSIGVALLGGLMWMWFGFQVVFLFGGLIALINLVSALFIKIPKELATGSSSG